MVIDDQRKCVVEGCKNIGQYKGVDPRKNGDTVITRRPLCMRHRREYRGVCSRKDSQSHKKFKRECCGECEYCGWVGPCDVHRPQPAQAGGKYTLDNMRSVCPNCHRLITLDLLVDKYSF